MHTAKQELWCTWYPLVQKMKIKVYHVKLRSVDFWIKTTALSTKSYQIIAMQVGTGIAWNDRSCWCNEMAYCLVTAYTILKTDSGHDTNPQHSRLILLSLYYSWDGVRGRFLEGLFVFHGPVLQFDYAWSKSIIRNKCIHGAEVVEILLFSWVHFRVANCS